MGTSASAFTFQLGLDVALYEEWTRVRMKTTSRKVGNNIRRAIFLEGRLFVSGKREQFTPRLEKNLVVSCSVAFE